MDTATRFVPSSDGTRIAYSVVGAGPALVHLQVPSASHIELYPRQPGAQAYLQLLGSGRTLVRIDFRGTGMSDREVSDHSPEALTDDLEAVVNALGLSRFELYAAGARVTPALRFAVRRPAAVTRLALASPFSPRPVSPGQPAEPGMLGLMESNWEAFLEYTTARNTRRPVTEIESVIAFVRRCMDHRNYVAETRASRQEEDWRLAASITVPVLVMELGRNALGPVGRLEAFSRQFPHGRFVALPEGSIAPPYGDPELVLQALGEFFGPVGESAVAPPEVNVGSLTPREREVLSLLAAGLTQPEVAAELCISPATVSRHVVSVYGKIGAHRRAEAVAWAIHHGMGPPAADSRA